MLKTELILIQQLPKKLQISRQRHFSFLLQLVIKQIQNTSS